MSMSIFFISLFIIDLIDSKLLSVTVFVRHGDRGPLIMIPDMPKGTNPGMLTTAGMKQHKTLGETIRKHYKTVEGFLPEKYDENDLYVRTSNYDRCLLSSWSHIAGLYANGAEEDGMFAIPIQAEKQDDEYYLRAFDICGGCLDQYDEYKKSDSFKKLVEKMKPTFDTLSDLLKVKVDETNMANIQDSLTVKMLKKGLSDEEKKGREELIKANHETRLHYFNVDDRNWLKASNGLILHELFVLNANADLKAPSSSSNQNTEANSNTSRSSYPSKTSHYKRAQAEAPHSGRRRYRLYSAHDSTVYSMLHTFGIDVPDFPYYAAALILELHDGKPEEEQNGNGDVNNTRSTENLGGQEAFSTANEAPYVKFFYQKEEEEARKGNLWDQFAPSFCSNKNCPLDEIVRNFSDVFIDPATTGNEAHPLHNYIKDICRPRKRQFLPLEKQIVKNTEPKRKLDTASIILGAVSGLFIILTCVFAISCHIHIKKLSKRSEGYESLLKS